MMIEKKKILSTLVIITLIATVFFNVQTSTVVFRPFVMIGSADEQHANNDSAWDNSTYLNVTVESKRPRILWYDFQKCTDDDFDGGWEDDIDTANWVSKRNNMTETDNETWYRFIINISSDQGWDNIEYINISGWHDKGDDSDTDGSLSGADGYNDTDNMGANRNFFMYYDNTSNDTAYFNLTYPANKTEITIGNFSEINVIDNLGIGGTETRNISFCFKPGYQFRYAPGPGEGNVWVNDSVNNTDGFPSGDGYHADTCSWESFDNPWSWNFNITVENYGENWGNTPYRSWVRDEFGIYSYTQIVSAYDVVIEGAPDGKYSTNGSSHFNQDPIGSGSNGESGNQTIQTRSNGNYSMTINITHLYHSQHVDNPFSSGDVDPAADGWEEPYALQINNSDVYVRGGNRTISINFSEGGINNCIWLYGFGDEDGSSNNVQYQTHERNGTSKFAGESNISDSGDTGPWTISELFPNGYDYLTFDSPNGPNNAGQNSSSIEFAVQIPQGQIAGKYTARVYYHLMTETHT